VSVFAMLFSIVVASVALAWSYAAADLNVPARWFLVIGALWILALWRRLNWLSSLAVLVFVAAAALGLWIGLPPSLMVLAAVGALVGWDLAAFTRRLRLAAPTDDVHGMEMRHLARVSIVAALAIAIAALSVLVHIRIPFELAVTLALIGTLGLTRLVAWLQREREE
jgi:hypothetical protein